MKAHVMVNHDKDFTHLHGSSFFITGEQHETLSLKFRSSSADQVLDIMRKLRSPFFPSFKCLPLVSFG